MVSIFDQLFDRSWLSENILNLYRIERKQTFPAWQQATEYARDLLAQEGYAPEFISFPADGKTTYQDKVLPIGWDVSNMKMTVVSPVPGLKDAVIADFQREPLEVVKHSVALPEGGITTRLITQSQMKAGTDVKDAFVLLDPSARPHKEDLQMLLDLGAYGWVSDYVENPLVERDGVAWLNAGTEHNSWHVPADERDFIGYQISPINGFYLRAACEAGEVLVHAESDAHRYETTLPAVTAVLKGECEEEVWMVAHLHEPLIDDNSSGVVGCIAIMNAMRRLAAEGKLKLKYSVRVVFASEMYGFAAYTEYIGEGRKKVLGAINMDGLVASTDKCATVLRAIEGPDYTGTTRTGGFAGNIFLYETMASSEKTYPHISFRPQPHRLSDDCSLGDASVGIPTIWLYHTPDGLHHNSVQDETIMDVENLMRQLSICADWIRRMACTNEDEIRAFLPAAVKRAQALIDAAAARPIRAGQDAQAYVQFICEREAGRIRALKKYCDIPEIEEAANQLQASAYKAEQVQMEGAWYDFSAKLRFTRLTRGFPHDLAKLPPDDRFRMPGDILEDDIASVISRFDGKVTMQDAFREVEWDKGMIFTEERIRNCIFTYIRLARAGYMDLQVEQAETAASLQAALAELGVKAGDTLLVNVCPDQLGYIEGDVQAVIEALLAAVGEEGTILVPAFARSVVLDASGVNRAADYRPYDTRENGELRDRSLRNDRFVRALLAREDLERSGHPTHEWLALGRNAAELVKGHGFMEAPFGEGSPVQKAMQRGAAVLCIGCSMNEHPLIKEAVSGSEADRAVFKYMDADGKQRIGMVDMHAGDAAVRARAEQVLAGAECGVPFGMTVLVKADF